MEIYIVEIESMRVRGLEHKGAYHTIGDTFTHLHDHRQMLGSKNAPLVAVYYDDPHQVPEEKLRSLAGVVMHEPSNAPTDPLQDIQIPEGKYAMTSFVGSYSNLGKAWEDFYGAIFKNGHKTKADLCFERHINTMQDTSPEELITELYAPLA